MAFHQDQVMKLPFGARRLGRQRFLPNAAYAIGGKILGIQGHPEFSPEFTDALLQKRGADMPLATTTAAHNSLKKTHKQNNLRQVDGDILSFGGTKLIKFSSFADKSYSD